MNAKVAVFCGILLLALPIYAEERTYCGSTPGGEPMLKMLGIPAKEAPELVEWKLSLQGDGRTQGPSRYEIRCRYGATAPNQPGLGSATKVIERSGTWEISRGTQADPDAIVYRLKGAVELCPVDGETGVLHVLNEDGTLMLGNGGYSYSLNSTGESEKAVDPMLAATVPDMSYRIDPLAIGANIFAVFEGRTPAQGIAKQLQINVPESATKAKWRITFYQDAETKVPTSFKVEGTLFRPNSRGGKWKVESEGKRTVYHLTFDEDRGDFRLLKGDGNVLFFLGADNKPRIGHCEFSYTLNRRSALPVVSQSDTPR